MTSVTQKHVAELIARARQAAERAQKGELIHESKFIRDTRVGSADVYAYNTGALLQMVQFLADELEFAAGLTPAKAAA